MESEGRVGELTLALLLRVCLDSNLASVSKGRLELAVFINVINIHNCMGMNLCVCLHACISGALVCSSDSTGVE